MAAGFAPSNAGGAEAEAGKPHARPEHLREFVAVRDRKIASRLIRAISKLIEVGISGHLCTEARWILNSRLVFLKKKKSCTPRPIRVGELWRGEMQTLHGIPVGLGSHVKRVVSSGSA